jgi:hypothetical protein
MVMARLFNNNLIHIEILGGWSCGSFFNANNLKINAFANTDEGIIAVKRKSLVLSIIN